MSLNCVFVAYWKKASLKKVYFESDAVSEFVHIPHIESKRLMDNLNLPHPYAAGSKLRRLRSAIDANIISNQPFPCEYLDAHTIAGVLKSYLRDLPEPLLTYQLFDQFIAASQRPTDEQRKAAILNVIKQLPKPNYDNLRYLSRFLGEFGLSYI